MATATSATLAALGEHRIASLLEEDERDIPRGLRAVVARPDSVRLALFCLDGFLRLALGASLVLLALDLGLRGASAVGFVAAGGLFAFLLHALARSFAARDPESSLSWAAPLGYAIELLLRPLVQPLSLLTRRIRGRATSRVDDTTEELEYLIEKGARSGHLDESHRDLLESVMEFSSVRVREIMVPRPKVVALSADASYDDVVKRVVESGHSRLPVYQESIDEIVGVLYAKRLLEDLEKGGAAVKARFRLAERLSPPFFVPETMKISHLLSEFQRRGLQIAVVVDEFGGTSGVVTLEDVVEEIVGDIRDESDLEEVEPIRQVGPGLFVAEGGASIRDVEDFLEEALEGSEPFEFPEEGDYETLGGFVTAMAGRVPAVGEQVVWDGLVFTVRGGDEKRVARVEIVVSPERGNKRGSSDEQEEVSEESGPRTAAMARESDEGFIAHFLGLRRT